MRAKSCVSRAKYSRTTPAGPSVSTCSRQFDFHDQDVSEIDYVPDTYSDGDNEELSEDLQPVAPQSNPKTKSSPRKSHNGDSQNNTDSNWLVKKICVQCGQGGQMLVCTETGCPIAFHQNCLSSKPKSDESGNYSCPYCTYKIAVEKAEMLRSKAILAKQALLNFLDARVGDGLKKAQKDGNISSKQASLATLGNQNQSNAKLGDGFKKAQKDVMINGKQASSSPFGNQNQGDATVGDGFRKPQKDGKIYRKHGIYRRNQNQDDDEVAVENNTDDHQGTDQDHCDKAVNEDLVSPFKKYHGRSEDHVDQSASCACEHDEEVLGHEKDVLEEGVEAVVHQPVKQASDTCHELMLLGSGVNQETSNAHQFTEKTVGQRKKQKRQHQMREATKSSTEGDSSKLKETVNIEVEKSERDIQASHHNISDNASKGQRGTAHPEIVDLLEKGSSQLCIPARSLHAKRTNVPVTFAIMKQKHLRWTAEEEEMLKEGVQKFSGSINKNIPWRKILEFGSHVFDPARRPMDLKEKWKKIVAKGHR